jgi:nitroimidazol reductase NimA-like FMN-containing flavoprotein (pyridoxamine 5'-phosphate oxidase superfamily)
MIDLSIYSDLRRRDRAMSLNEAEKFLEEQMVGRLALTRNDHPYVVPLNYLYLEGKIYFHSAKDGQKIAFLRENHKVCFEVDGLFGFTKGEADCSYAPLYKSVIAYGKATIVEENTEKMEVLSSLVQKYYGSKPDSFANAMLEDTLVVVIEISKLTGKQRLQ